MKGPRKGRYRQFYQAGIELLGYSEGLAELEMISMILSINDALGIKNSKIKINHLGNKDAKDQFCEALKNYLKPFSSKLEKLDLDRLNKNPLRVLDSKSEQTKDILKDAPKMNEFVSKESLDLLNLIKNSFSEHNIEIDYSLVRGLDYYTGFIFEAISDDLGAQDSYLAVEDMTIFSVIWVEKNYQLLVWPLGLKDWLKYQTSLLKIKQPLILFHSFI